MESTPFQWLPHSPFRSPSWRWARACWLHTTKSRTSRRLDDRWVRRALSFLATADRYRGTEGVADATPDDPPVGEAVRLARAGQSVDCWQLEALLLTDVQLEEVARRCSLSPATVEAYHELFFSVRPHLAARDWIMIRAIGGDAWHGFTGQPLGAVWKYVAYTAGPRALEAVIAVTTDQPLPDWLRTSFVANAAYEEARFRLKCKLTLTALAAESPAELKALIEIHHQLRRLDRQMVGVPDQSPGMLEAMQLFLKLLARRPPSAKKPSEPRTSRAGNQASDRAEANRERRPATVLQGCGT